ncbi:hypothetical protein RB195_007572 [Necator americanus]|uniref:MSP domain protein n=2 Tax=Necator americanus TaxID=51031 RepID=W2TX27_NECAM|nr:MSP domain protein [Necator americanus]ETN86229.1 MSP domain protein [Necator americanus]
MSVTSDPPAANLPAAGGTSTHNLVNGTQDRLIFKVKSTNNNEYRVNPVFGFIDPGAQTPLEVIRSAGPPKEDKLVVHYAPAPADATDAQASFGVVIPTGDVTIMLTAT